MDNKKKNILIAVAVVFIIIIVFVIFGLVEGNNQEELENKNTTIEDSIPEPENLEFKNDNPTETISTP